MRRIWQRCSGTVQPKTWQRCSWASFSEAYERGGRRLLGEACWLDGDSELLNFMARLDRVDPMKLVTTVHAAAPFDLRDVEDLDPYEVALAIVQAYAP